MSTKRKSDELFEAAIGILAGIGVYAVLYTISRIINYYY